MARQMSLRLTKVVGNADKPDTGRTVLIVDAQTTLTVATAVETPAGSGLYSASFSEVNAWGYWQIDGVTYPGVSQNSPFWLGAYDVHSGSFSGSLSGNASTATTASYALNVPGNFVQKSGDQMTGALGISASLQTAQDITVGRKDDTSASIYLRAWDGNLIKQTDGPGNCDVMQFFVGIKDPINGGGNYDSASMTVQAGNTNLGVDYSKLFLDAGDALEQGNVGGHVYVKGGSGNGGSGSVFLSGSNVYVDGTLRASSVVLTGSLHGTASHAVSASYAPGGEGGTPGGNTSEFQYNGSGSFSGSALLRQVGGGVSISGSLTTVTGALGVSGAFNESTNDPGIYLGTVAGTPRILFAPGNATQNWQIDTVWGYFRWYTPGVEHFLLYPTESRFVDKHLRVSSGSIEVTGSLRINTATAGVLQYDLTVGSTTASLSKVILKPATWGAGSHVAIFFGDANHSISGSYAKGLTFNTVDSMYFNSDAYHYTGTVYLRDGLVIKQVGALPGVGIIVSGSITTITSASIINGNTNASTLSSSIDLQYDGGGYAHSIRTRHNGGGRYGNAIDFFLWKQGTDSSTTKGTQIAISIEDSTNGPCLRIGRPVTGTANPPGNLDVVGNGTFTGPVTASAFLGTASFATSASYAVTSSRAKRFGEGTIQNNVGVGGYSYTCSSAFASVDDYHALVFCWTGNGSGSLIAPSDVVKGTQHVTVYAPEETCKVQITVLPQTGA